MPSAGNGAPAMVIIRRETAPAVVVHEAAGAAMALALAGGGGLVLLSAPGAAGSLGAAWFLAMMREAEARARREGGAEAPGRGASADGPGCCDAPLWVLDCGDAPGHALAALRAGVPALILDPVVPAFAAVAAAAAEAGAAIWTARPPALDLRGVDLRREAGRARLAAWLRPEVAPHRSAE